MAVYAISDLHLSFSSDKPMDVFGEQWKDYTARIQENWRNEVKDEDLVLIGGDISWAMHLAEARVDLKWVEDMPGHKYMIKGNHDYWWTSLKKMNLQHPQLKFVYNNSFVNGKIGLAGTRGWVCPNSKEFTADDQKIYQRELLRLENSLKQVSMNDPEQIIAMIHYPPMNDNFEDSGFTELFEAYSVTHVVYGHLHSPEGFKVGFDGVRNGVAYHLTSCDFLDFKLKCILK